MRKVCIETELKTKKDILTKCINCGENYLTNYEIHIL